MTNALAIAKQQTSGEIVALQSSASMIASLEIHDDDDRDFAGEILGEVKARSKFIEGQRTAITKPLLQAKRDVDALFAPIKKLLGEAERSLKSKLAGYLAGVEAANAAALAVVASTDDADEAEAALAEVVDVEPPKGVSMRWVWRAEIHTPDVVPRRYCEPDQRLLDDAAGPDVEIPGVRMIKHSIVSARAAQ